MRGPNAVRLVLCAAVAATACGCSKEKPAQHADRRPVLGESPPPSLPTAPAPAGPCKLFSSPAPVGQVQNIELIEISGLAASRTRPGVVYAHNDSGDSARF